MNKKIIAIAIATVMAAPVAMADVKVSGKIGGDLTMNNDDSRSFNDNGYSQFNIIATQGDAFAKIGMNMGPGANAGENYIDNNTAKTIADVTGTDALKTSKGGPVYRDFILGTKVAGGKLSFGTMSGAVKNLEKDALIATFLQVRKTAANAVAGGSNYGSSGFVANVIDFSTKVSGMSVKVQYDPTTLTGKSKNSGHIGAAVKGKAGGISYWAGYNNAKANGSNDTATNSSNIKVGGAMKFGGVKATVQYTSADADGTANSGILVMGNMGLGNGLSVDVAYGTRSGDSADATVLRAAVIKNLNAKTRVYAGYKSTTVGTADAVATTGAGMVMNF